VANDDAVTPLSPEAVSFFTGKRIIITGGGGSVGTELVEQLLAHPVDYIRVIDNNETSIFRLSEHLRGSSKCGVFYCDIRDEYETNRMFSGMHYCFHGAALKHVPSCEHSPFSAVQTNIIGTQQVIGAALRNRLTQVLITSSDKAVNPTSVMGTSKLMAERLFTAANSLSEGSHRCTFSSTRFGNVAGSQGSVIPLFCDQIRLGRDLTLTHSGMTRFIMTLADAGRLVIESMAWARGGEIFITKMPVVAIKDLARVMVRLIAPCYGRSPSDTKIIEIGPRPGEKIWEELNTDEEVRRTYDLGKYLVVLPALQSSYGDPEYSYRDLALRPCEKVYHSGNETAMSDSEIEQLLLQPNVLPADVRGRLGLESGEH
jgi:FlaA1/EpsC-like NDP-sugar epimerase